MSKAVSMDRRRCRIVAASGTAAMRIVAASAGIDRMDGWAHSPAAASAADGGAGWPRRGVVPQGVAPMSGRNASRAIVRPTTKGATARISGGAGRPDDALTDLSTIGAMARRRPGVARVLDHGRAVLRVEAAALLELAGALDAHFCPGRSS
jgi:hypothetical protein